MANPHKNNIGVTFVLTVKNQDGNAIDISAASPKNLVFLKPDKATRAVQAGTFTSGGTDGRLQYTTASASDLDQDGPWSVQAVVTLGANQYTSSLLLFQVDPNL